MPPVTVESAVPAVSLIQYSPTVPPTKHLLWTGLPGNAWKHDTVLHAISSLLSFPGKKRVVSGAPAHTPSFALRTVFLSENAEEEQDPRSV